MYKCFEYMVDFPLLYSYFPLTGTNVIISYTDKGKKNLITKMRHILYIKEQRVFKSFVGNLPTKIQEAVVNVSVRYL
jgi:hypothetical protein